MEIVQNLVWNRQVIYVGTIVGHPSLNTDTSSIQTTTGISNDKSGGTRQSLKT